MNIEVGQVPLAAVAHQLHHRGYHPFPVDHPDQALCIGKHGPNTPCDGQRGKHPAVSWSTWAVAATPEMIDAAWAARGGLANIGIACGPANLVVLDGDLRGETARWAVTYGINLPDTYTVTTRQGDHKYFRWNHAQTRIGNGEKALRGFKMNVRGHGGYVVAAGSRHAFGTNYFGNGLPVADLPVEVAELLLTGTTEPAPAQSELASFWDARNTNHNVDKIESGERHNALIAYAGRLLGKGLDFQEALPSYLARWRLCVQPAGQIPEAEFHDPECPYPVTWEEAEAKLRDVYGRYPAGESSDKGIVGLTADERVEHSGQVRMAYRLVDDYEDRLLHVRGIGWFHWDGQRWAVDDTGAANRAVVAILRRGLAQSLNDPTLRRDVRKCESSAGIAGVLAVAAALPPFAASVRELDSDPYLVNHADGTLDLRTLETGPHSPADRITKVAKGAYRPEAGAPTWTAFLERVLPDVSVREFLCRYVGLGLLGAVREHKLVIGIGIGANGKSVFDQAIRNMYGDYAIVAEPDVFMAREGAHPTGQMDLLGVRWATVSESERDRRLAEAAVKRLTGGDTIRARRMRQDHVEFTATHTAMLFTNHLPRVSGDDPAIWRRLLVVVFGVVIAAAEQDPHLGEQLELEADGILTWAVEGYRQYCTRGLDAPSSVAKATDDYQRASDAVRRFVEDECLTSSPALKSTTGQLHAQWEQWRVRDGAEAMSVGAFGKALDRLGFPQGERTSMGRWRCEIAIKPRLQ